MQQILFKHEKNNLQFSLKTIKFKSKNPEKQI